MKARARQSGVTLMETTIVVAMVSLLTAFSMPAIRAFFNSLATQGSTRAVISAALSSARAIAAKEQHYAGIRFQKAYNPDDPLNPLEAAQYMIFIVHDYDRTGLENGFRAVEGLEPIRLPDDIGVMDLRYRTNLDPRYSGDDLIDDDSEINVNVPERVRDTTTFSIVFSPSGKMVIHDVRIRNRHGIYQPVNLNDSADDIFNSPENIVNNDMGMFVQDDYAELGLGVERSRSSFVIYERGEFRRAYERGLAYSEYLYRLVGEAIYINPYTGTIISTD